MSDDQPAHVDAAEIRAIAGRSQLRAYSSLIGAATTVVAMVAFVIISLLFLGSADHGNQLSERQNCVQSYSSILGAPVTKRDNLTSQVASLVGQGQGIFGGALLKLETGQQPSPAVISAFEANENALAAKRVALDKEISVVQAEPTVAEASVNGFTFAGHRYPACPDSSD